MHKTHVLITIDTEFSIGGYFKNKENKPVPADKTIYCKIDGKEYGINLIMDILDRYHLPGIFFVETESRFYFGDDIILDVIRHIRNRGHEVQLHTHPNFRTFKGTERTADDMRKYSLEQQEIILKEALTFLKNNQIDDIIAHRSGGFYSNTDTLTAQAKSGIKYSTNYNAAFPNCTYVNNQNPENDIYKSGEIYELPVTCYKEFPLRKEWNSFQLSAASFTEIKKAFRYYYKEKINIATFITHSFEFVKTFDQQYNKVVPQTFLIKRFEKFCRFLADNKEIFPVITFQELDKLVSNKEISIANQPKGFYKSSLFDTANRYLGHLILPYFK